MQVISKKILFVDRDGTLIVEPPKDFQVDTFDKLEFYPGVFFWLGKIVRELEYELVMVTNQDGLGTQLFPETSFWPIQNKIIQFFKNEGIVFEDVLIDRSFEEENAPTRKPGLGMLNKYIYGAYNLNDSFVIGDRLTDIQLATNLNAKGIYLGKGDVEEAELCAKKWEEIYNFLANVERKSKVCRVTNETKIQVELNLDGKGISNINTGLGFFDHMLEQISKHGNFDIGIEVTGDLDIDDHHTIEDVGLVLGTAFLEALGNKKSIERYGFLLPMDDCLAQVAIDFGGRPYCIWNCDFKRENIGGVSTEMFSHFFKSFSVGSFSNINIMANGNNEHHKIESIFKSFAKSLRLAVSKNNSFQIPSTKGSL